MITFFSRANPSHNLTRSPVHICDSLLTTGSQGSAKKGKKKKKKSKREREKQREQEERQREAARKQAESDDMRRKEEANRSQSDAVSDSDSDSDDDASMLVMFAGISVTEMERARGGKHKGSKGRGGSASDGAERDNSSARHSKGSSGNGSSSSTTFGRGGGGGAAWQEAGQPKTRSGAVGRGAGAGSSADGAGGQSASISAHGSTSTVQQRRQLAQQRREAGTGTGGTPGFDSGASVNKSDVEHCRAVIHHAEMYLRRRCADGKCRGPSRALSAKPEHPDVLRRRQQANAHLAITVVRRSPPPSPRVVLRCPCPFCASNEAREAHHVDPPFHPSLHLRFDGKSSLFIVILVALSLRSRTYNRSMSTASAESLATSLRSDQL